MTEDKPKIEIVKDEMPEAEEVDNVVFFKDKNPNDEEKVKFTLDDFLENISKNKEGIDSFFFIGINADGNSVVSAKADNNLHLHWILKRFLTHLEGHLYG